MVRTFAFRHSSIRDGGMPLEEQFQMYPPIKEADEVCINQTQAVYTKTPKNATADCITHVYRNVVV